MTAWSLNYKSVCLFVPCTISILFTMAAGVLISQQAPGNPKHRHTGHIKDVNLTDFCLWYLIIGTTRDKHVCTNVGQSEHYKQQMNMGATAGCSKKDFCTECAFIFEGVDCIVKSTLQSAQLQVHLLCRVNSYKYFV